MSDELAEHEVCAYCGDPAVVHYRKRAVCEDCRDELAFGVIKNQNVNFFGGNPTTMEDDAGPWQSNAIRDLEE